jgi:hypothetical protein
MRRDRIILALIVALAVALRAWNAGTAVFQPDEPDLMEDAAWSVSPLPLGTAIDFLRRHPRDHLRLIPGTSTLVPRGPENPGHLGLYPFLMGLVVYVAQPHGLREAVLLGRAANILADGLVIALVPRIVAGLGGSVEAGLLAAALLAFYPPAIVYGSTANLDPLLALFLALLVLDLLRPPRHATWLLAGILTGLCVGEKQTGLVALAWVPLVWLLASARRPGALLAWALPTVALAILIADPLAYLDALRHPTHPFVELTFDPVHKVVGNVAWLAEPSSYYSLSFSRHAEPLAPLFARVHRLVTPGYLLLFAAGLAGALVRAEPKSLLFAVVPVLMVLAFIQPSDGMWRFHLLCPLVASLAALEITRLSARWRRSLLVVALAVGLVPLLPQRPQAGGAVDLGELLFMNPHARQQPGFYAWWKMTPLVVTLPPGVELRRMLWLAPGPYDVTALARGDARVEIDGHEVLPPGTTGRVELDGHLHRLAVSLPQGGLLAGLVVAPAAK